MEIEPNKHTDSNVLTDEKVTLKRPRLFKVFFHNDDYTPMEFVVSLLQQIFHRSREESTRIMLTVHTKGIGLCGVYTSDIARTKQMQVNEAARQNEHPLKCSIEPEDDSDDI